MFIVKVRDHATATTHATMPDRIYRLIDWDTWKPCLMRYSTYEQAKALVDRQLEQLRARPTRYGETRDFRIYEQEGRQLKVVYEYLAEQGE